MTILPITGAAEDTARILASSVDGFIVWTTADDDPVLAAVLATGRPAVVHGGPAVPGLGLVGIDDRSAARAVGAVAFAGARRPAVMSFPLSRERTTTTAHGIDSAGARFPVTRERLLGFRQAAEDVGTAWDDVLVVVCARNDAEEARRVAFEVLSASDPPDAFAAMSDEQAAGISRAARAAGIVVPDDLALTGWDDAAVAAQLGLTTVAQSMREQGAACARAALGQEPHSVSAPWSIIRRASTHP